MNNRRSFFTGLFGGLLVAPLVDNLPGRLLACDRNEDLVHDRSELERELGLAPVFKDWIRVNLEYSIIDDGECGSKISVSYKLIKLSSLKFPGKTLICTNKNHT